MVNSRYCQFEFDAFLARERALGRDDLIFPVIYVPVGALADEARWRDHPVLAPIARRQYVDWQTFRYVDVPTPAMREEIARFCHKIVEALNAPWLSPQEREQQEQLEAQRRADEERRRRDIETERRAREEAQRRQDEDAAQRLAEQRRQQEIANKQRADDEARRKEAEAQRRQRDEAEHQARTAEAKRRADDERAFAAAKRADSVSAVDDFLGGHPNSHLGADADALRTALLERDQAYQAAMTSTDTALLTAFLARYPSGKPANEIRKRLRQLEPAKGWRPSRRAVLIGSGAVGAAAAAGGAALMVFRHRDDSIRTFLGHSSTVSSVGFFPDGDGLSGSWDGSIRAWNLKSGTGILTLRGSNSGEGVTSVAILPSGRSAVAGGWRERNGILRVWDLANGTLVRAFTIDGQNGEVDSVTVAPDGHTVLSVSFGGTLRLWDSTTGNTTRTLTISGGSGHMIALSRDGRTVLSLGDNRTTLRLWDLASGQTIRTMSGHTRDLRTVALAPDDRRVLSGGEDETIRLWDVETGSTIRVIFAKQGVVSSLAFAPDGRTALSGGGDGTLKLWDLTTGSAIRTFMGHDGFVPSLAIAADGRTALSGGFDSTVKLWDLTDAS